MGPDVPARPLNARPDPDPASASPGPASRVSRWRELAEVLLVAVVFALFVRTFLFQAFVVPSASMERTVLVGDHLLVNKFACAPHRRGLLARLLPYRPIRRGDVVVFKFPEDPKRDFVKRAVALPGDLLEIHDKEVFVNGLPEAESHAFHSEERVWHDDPQLPRPLRQRDQLRPMRVPADAYFMMGDNRDDSYDSRFWGPVPAGNLKGRALLVYWSFPPRETGRGLFERMRDFFSQTRWSRTLLLVR